MDGMRVVIRGAVVLVSLLLTAAASASAAPLPLAAVGPTTPAEMESFVDGFMQAQMDGGQLGGATVAVVKDGALFFAKGYGYEDVARRTPADPAQTLFRVGSVSKLITWTAVMQLVEAGTLDLDTDINTYLKDLQIAQTYPQPITLRNLMTHTAGFEDGMVGYTIVSSAQELVPLNEWLRSHQPKRVRPPTTDFNSGTNASYSNYGTALAAHVVEAVSGMAYDDYVERRIFTPLGMTRATFREPLPPALASHLTSGYVFSKGQLVARPFEFLHSVAPAAGLSATASDMARFMIAYLEGGGGILKSTTVDQMLARVLNPDPYVNGIGLGFYEFRVNGQRVIGHHGDTIYFHSVVSLLPDHHLGLFVSVNTAGTAGHIPNALTNAFVRHYFPATLPVVQPPSDANTRNVRYAGTYRSIRHSYTKFEKLIGAGSEVTAMPMPDGTLAMPEPDSGREARWVEVGDGVFRDAASDAFVAFKDEVGGHATALVGTFAPIAFARLAWYDSLALHGSVLVIALLLALTSIVSAIRQRRADREGPVAIRWARPALAVTGALIVAGTIGLVLVLTSGLEALMLRIPTSFYVAETLPLLAIPAVTAALYFSVLIWFGNAWHWAARLHYTLATLAAVAFLLVLQYWNLVGYRVG